MSGDYQQIGDQELAGMVRENRPDAFAELSSRYLWLIRSKAALFRGPAVPEREDLIQEGFLGLYVAALTFSETGGASFRTYAGVCVYHRMASAVRRHGSLKNRPLNESVSLDSPDASAAAAQPGPEDLVELREQMKSLLEEVERSLTPLERKALSLYLDGCKRQEIPQRSGMSLRAFDNAMYRVRGKLKQGNPRS